jgi:UDPglucose 6-dehydrogenase
MLLMSQLPKISVIGVGYVGLCTAVGLASKGYSVLACDIDSEKIAKINSGVPPFYEPGLQEKLTENIKQGNHKGLVDDTNKAIGETDFTYVAVGTPSKDDGSIDLKYIESAATNIGQALRNKKGYHITIIKSTVVPGTTLNTVLPRLEKESGKKCGVHFGLCMNPEFLRQGSAFNDTLNADRVVVGSFDKKSGDKLEALYRDFYSGNIPPIIRTGLSTAELIKYASNAMLATKISFINSIANICEKIPGADVKDVALAMGLDKRIGPLFLDAGLGYGGSCFPKDVKALIACAKALGYTPTLLDSVERVNKMQPLKAVEYLEQQLGALKGKRIALLGLAFKPDTDDMREARVIPIVQKLLAGDAIVTAYDPIAITTAQAVFKNTITYAASAKECLKGADAAIIITEWPEFKQITPQEFKKLLKQPNLIDGRRIYNPQTYKKQLNYIAIGLGP